MTENLDNAKLHVLVFEHERTADAALVGECLDAVGIEYSVVGPETGIPVPESISTFDGLIVLGGSPGPTDDEIAPWMPAVRTLIREALDKRIPYLGICLGAQLLAHVAGGVVELSAAGPEVGLVDMKLTKAGREDQLLGGIDGDVMALQWHWLEIVSLPAGSVSLCSSERCANQAFRVGENAWGVQFHMEALARTAIQWCIESAEQLAEMHIDPVAEIIVPIQEAEPDLIERWSLVTNRWIDVVKENATIAA